MLQSKSEKLSCCHQQYLSCKQKQENDAYFALVFNNKEPSRLVPMGSLEFEKLDANPETACSDQAIKRGGNNVRSDIVLFKDPAFLLETRKPTYVNGPVCKQGVCCYKPSHQTFMNLSKQWPI